MKKSQYIRLTRAAIIEMFNECNRLYFQNSVELPIAVELWTPFKKTVGMVRPGWSKKHKQTKSILHISKRYRWTEENLRKVVTHEMIHLAICDYKEPLTFLQRLPLIGQFFIKEHGENFIAMMNDINEKYGLGISVRIPQMKKDFRG